MDTIVSRVLKLMIVTLNVTPLVVQNLRKNMASHSMFCIVSDKLIISKGPIVYLTVAGQPVVVLNTIKAAADLFDRRADIYSDR